MLTKSIKYVAIIYFFIIAFFAWNSQAKSQTYIYNQAKAVDVQDSLHRNLENIALDEMTVGVDEKLRKENVTVLKDVNYTKKEIKKRFYEYVENHPDIKITKYKDDIYTLGKIGGSYTKGIDKLRQTESQLPTIAIDVSGVYYNTIQGLGEEIIETPFEFKVTVDLDFIEVTETKDERQPTTTNKQGNKNDFSAYKNNSYFQSGSSFTPNGIITK